jgi:hypothetical protein
MQAANSSVTFQGYLSEDEIFDALYEIGETGSFRLGSGNDLLIKKEENSSELRYGQVDPDTDVQSIFESIVK